MVVPLLLVLAAPAPFAVRVLACFMRRFAFGGLRIDEVRLPTYYMVTSIRAILYGNLVRAALAYCCGSSADDCYLVINLPRRCVSSSARCICQARRRRSIASCRPLLPRSSAEP